LLRRSVEALLSSEKVDVEVVLVDNGCTTDDVVQLSTLSGVTVIGDGANLGFSGGCNLGVAHSTGDYIALINGDAVVEPTTLARLVEELGQPSHEACRNGTQPAFSRVGIAAGAVRLADNPDLLNSSGNPVHVLGISWVGGLGERDTRTAPTETAGAMGACLVIGWAASTRTTSPTARTPTCPSAPGAWACEWSTCPTRSPCTGTNSAATTSSSTWSSATA
jgi:GT2 family glycosyltransferase